MALEGLSHLISTIERVREKLNPSLAIIGLVLTMYDSRTKLAQAVETRLGKSHAPNELKPDPALENQTMRPPGSTILAAFLHIDTHEC